MPKLDATGYKNPIIIGAGPIGLITAILLKQKGVENITVYDKRSEYLRPGSVLEDTFDHIGDHINYPMPRREMHIKELERGLKAIAESLKIKIIHENFVKFINGGIQITDGDKATKNIPCDLAIDASGSKAVLVNSVNKLYQQPPFKATPIDNNPIKNSIFAHVYMQPTDVGLLMKTVNDIKITTAQQDTRYLEHLRQFYGWPHFASPLLYAFQGKKTRDNRLQKVLFTCEIPEKLTPDKYEDYLRAVLRLKTGNDAVNFKHLNPSKHHASKNYVRFNAFSTQPQEVTPAYFSSDPRLPTVIPVGDAQIQQVEFHAAIGIDKGLERAQSLVDSLTIKNGQIQAIDFNNYTQEMQPQIAEEKEQFSSFYFNRRYTLFTETGTASMNYKKAIQQTKDPRERDRLTKNMQESANKAIELIMTPEMASVRNMYGYK